MDDRHVLVEEWKEIRQSLRYWGNRRLTLLTIFVAGNVFMFHEKLAPRPPWIGFLFPVVGILGSAIFARMEQASVQHWMSFVERAKEIENQVEPLELMSKWRPQDGAFATATAATYCVYLLVATLWCITLVLEIWR